MSCITYLPKVFAVTACKKMTLAPSKKLAPKCQPLLDRTNFRLRVRPFATMGANTPQLPFIFNLTRKLENQLQTEAGISFVEYMVLAMLSESKDNSLTMTELAITTNTLPARLSRVVARLEKDGYVRRSLSAEDRRVSICHLLPAGDQKVQEVAPGHVNEVRRQIFDHLTTEQVEHLAEIGEAVLGNTPSNVISIDALKRGDYPTQ